MDNKIFMVERVNDTIVVNRKRTEKITPAEYVRIIERLTEMVAFP